jgi:predicted nucleic acid-binding Zn ribbon protein
LTWCRGEVVTVISDSEFPEPADPVSLTSALDAVVRSLSPGTSARALGGVFGHWDDIVGAQIAEHVSPAKLEDGRLVVVVDQPGWATQMRYLHDDVLSRIAAVVGTGVVREIEVRVRGTDRAANRSSQRR